MHILRSFMMIFFALIGGELSAGDLTPELKECYEVIYGKNKAEENFASHSQKPEEVQPKLAEKLRALQSNNPTIKNAPNSEAAKILQYSWARAAFEIAKHFKPYLQGIPLNHGKLI